MKLAVGPDEAGERLDRLLVKKLPRLSRARIQQLIEGGHVLAGGKSVKASLRPRAGMELVVRIPAPEPVALVPEEMKLPVLFEDEHLLVIDKPAGIAVHPGAGIRTGTIVHGLLHQVRDLGGVGGELRPGIVHRLDKDTSGCLVVAKHEAALTSLQALFKARQVEKRYHALVHGKPPDEGELDTFFGRHPVHRKRFSSKVTSGRRAVTRFRVVGKAHGAAWVAVELLTGRTHQIRAHFADAGWPIFRDVLYGGVRREAKLEEGSPARRAAEALGRQGLHASRLVFRHPITAAQVACEAPLPPDLRAALQILGF